MSAFYEHLTRELRPLLASAGESFGMLVLDVRVEHLSDLIARLAREFRCELLLDVTAVDYPEREPRFDVVYHFYHRTHHQRVRVKTSVGADHPHVPTLTTLYGAARFLEREVHDMYGIVFDGNADLRPILLYEGFVGHPLRKDYSMEAEQPIVPYRE